MHQFLERCMALVPEPDRDEMSFRRLREHPDTWSAAAGLARYVVAAASSPLLRMTEGDVRLRQQMDAEIWRACADAESRVCWLLREIFRFESPGEGNQFTAEKGPEQRLVGAGAANRPDRRTP
jgi:hypothetical protein